MFSRKYLFAGLLFLGLTLISGCTPKNVSAVRYDALAQHLTAMGYKMYGTSWCGACANQKELFGTSWQYINYEECSVNGTSEQTEICMAEDITAYPTWQLPNGDKEKGMMSLEELAEMSDFS